MNGTDHDGPGALPTGTRVNASSYPTEPQDGIHRFKQVQFAQSGVRSEKKLSTLRALRFRLLPRIPRRRQSDMAGECDTERTCGAIANTFSNFGDARFITPQPVLCQSHAPCEQVSHRATPIARLNRSKNAERERAASFASCAAVQDYLIFWCMRRIETVRRSSASPRKRPSGAGVPSVDRGASRKRTSKRRARMTSRPGRCARDSSLTSCTIVASLFSSRTCTSCGRSDTSDAAFGEPKAQWPTNNKTSGGPL